MAWSAPPSFVSGNVLTAAQLNVLSNNLLETMPAKAVHGVGSGPVASGAYEPGPGYFATTGANTIAEMQPARHEISQYETLNSAAFSDLATIGPQVSVQANAFIVVICLVALYADTANTAATGWGLTGATSQAVGNNGPSINGSANNQMTVMTCRSAAVNSGVTTVTLQYVTTAGTNGWFGRRYMTVWPF